MEWPLLNRDFEISEKDKEPPSSADISNEIHRSEKEEENEVLVQYGGFFLIKPLGKNFLFKIS